MKAFFITIAACLFSTMLTRCIADMSLTEKTSHFFSLSLIRGLYGRIFEYTEIPTSDPCPQRITHRSSGFRNSASRSWLVPHNSIEHDSFTCTDGAVLSLRAFNNNTNISTSFNTEFPIRHRIARQTFRILRNHSTGFWMGVDARKCDRFLLPFPTYIFFVREPHHPIKTPFRVSLASRVKYLFIVSKSFACIYGNAGTLPSRTNETNVKRPFPSEIPSFSPQPSTDSDSETDFSDDDEADLSTSPSVSTPGAVHPSPSASNAMTIPYAGQALCFPGHATVQLSTGEKREMKDVRIGDVVRSRAGDTSKIFTFSHHDPFSYAVFLTIWTGCSRKVSLTEGHFLYVNGRLREAETVRIGDYLTLGNGSMCIVTAVRREWHRGVFNPHSLVGDLLVNDVRTSSYTSAMPYRSAHGMLTPIRALSLLLESVCTHIPILPHALLLQVRLLVSKYFSL